jgi:hypothetical protein
MEPRRTSEATDAGFRFQHTHKPSRSVSQRRPELVCALRYAKVEPERVQSSGTEFGVSGSDSGARLQVKIRSNYKIVKRFHFPLLFDDFGLGFTYMYMYTFTVPAPPRGGFSLTSALELVKVSIFASRCTKLGSRAHQRQYRLEVSLESVSEQVKVRNFARWRTTLGSRAPQEPYKLSFALEQASRSR